MARTKDAWFGPRLKEARESAGLTQEQLAELVPVAAQTVKDWERGRKHPMLEKLPRLAEVLGVDPGRFFPESCASDRVQEGDPTADTVEERLERIERQILRVLAEVRSLGTLRASADPAPGD